MEITETLYITSGKEWRAWLKKHHQAKSEIWLIYYRKSSGKPRISYNEAVDEALCYGWIDGIVKGMDEERFTQRFTPRRPNSNLSHLNKERVRQLIADKKMTKAGLDAIVHAFDAKTDKPGKVKLPKDIKQALMANKQAWEYWQQFPEKYKRIRVGYIKDQGYHGQEAYDKALKNLVKMTAKNKRFGFVRE